eukprot:gene30955-38255_t
MEAKVESISSGSTKIDTIVRAKIEEIPTDSIFVCDLSVLHTGENLRKLFRQFGTVLAVDHKLWSNDGSPSLTGYCFIKFQTVSEATSAKNAMHGKESFGRILRIGWTSVKELSQQVPNSVQALVSFSSTQIDHVVYEQTLRELVTQYNTTECEILDIAIKTFTIQRHRNTYNGMAFIHFPRSTEGVTAVKSLVSQLRNVSIHGVTYDFLVTHELKKILRAEPALESRDDKTKSALAMYMDQKPSLLEIPTVGVDFTFASPFDIPHRFDTSTAPNSGSKDVKLRSGSDLSTSSAGSGWFNSHSPKGEGRSPPFLQHPSPHQNSGGFNQQSHGRQSPRSPLSRSSSGGSGHFHALRNTFSSDSGSPRQFDQRRVSSVPIYSPQQHQQQ